MERRSQQPGGGVWIKTKNGKKENIKAESM